MSSFPRRFKQMHMCSFIFSTYFLFKVKELLKIHKPLHLAIVCHLLRVKDIGEWSVERDACISVFFIDSDTLLETKNNQAFAVCILKYDFNRKQNVFLLDFGFSKYHTIQNVQLVQSFSLEMVFPLLLIILNWSENQSVPLLLCFYFIYRFTFL